MHTVFASGQYNFLYAALVYNVNAYADARLTDYNLHWLPSCYFDGGYIYDYGISTSAIATGLDGSCAREVPALDLSVTLTWLGSASIQVDVSIANNESVNSAPLTPEAPEGQGIGTATFRYPFTAKASDPDNDPLYYMFDWGDSQQSDWLGPFAPGDDGLDTHRWTMYGTYDVKARVQDTAGAESAWSPVTTIHLAKPGNANGDASVNVGDAVFIISYIFREGPAPPYPNAADANCDTKVNVGDAVYIISYIFRQGPAPGCN
ncbi:MAG: dockerin type I domain-containing protein [candidate division Zixibacteria bacterium]|nr:dockerin type I domain-containing protein [candidate division Zixibacteria bacterium]